MIVHVPGLIQELQLKGAQLDQMLYPQKNYMTYSYKLQRIPKGQSKMDNPGKLEKHSAQDEEKQKHNAMCVGHYYT